MPAFLSLTTEDAKTAVMIVAAVALVVACTFI